MHVYILPMPALLTKGKLDRKQNMKTDKGGKRKGISPTHGSGSSASLQATEARQRIVREPSACKALKALVYLSCF